MAAATVTPLVNISEYWYEYISPSAWTKNINRQFVVITYKFIVVTLWSSEPGPILMVGHVRMMGCCRSHSTHRVAPVASGTTLPCKNENTNIQTKCTIFDICLKKEIICRGAVIFQFRRLYLNPPVCQQWEGGGRANFGNTRISKAPGQAFSH